MATDFNKAALEMAIPPFLSGRSRAMPLGFASGAKAKNSIRVNLNGRVFHLSRSTCIRIPILQRLLTQKKVVEKRKRTTVTSMQSTGVADKVQDELYFERNPNVFAAIIDYVQNNELHAPPHVCSKLFARDLSFWGFNIDEVESCCFSKIVHFLWEQVKLNKFHGFLQRKSIGTASDNSSTTDGQNGTENPRGCRNIRTAVWRILDEPFTSKVAQVDWGW